MTAKAKQATKAKAKTKTKRVRAAARPLRSTAAAKGLRLGTRRLKAAVEAAANGTPPGALRPAFRGDIVQVAVAALWPSPLNPRKVADEAAVTSLAESIAAEGVLQNLVARPSPAARPGAAPYEIVAGERRWRAASALIAAGRWPADAALPVRVLDDCSDLDLLHYGFCPLVHEEGIF